MPSSRSIDWGELFQKSAHLGKKQPRYEGGLLGKLQCCHSLFSQKILTKHNSAKNIKLNKYLLKTCFKIRLVLCGYLNLFDQIADQLDIN